MKIVVSMVLSCVAGSTVAASLSPAHQNFHMVGDTSINSPDLVVNCMARLEGRIDSKGVGEITFANFKNTNVNCPDKTRLEGLPWKFRATGLGAGKIEGVTITVLLKTYCGPSTIPVHIGNGGIVSFDSAHMNGKCSFTGSLQSTPPITAAP